MVDKKISELDPPATLPLSGSETAPIVQSGDNYEATVLQIAAPAVAAHVAESDPHTQYLTELAAALAYQPLSASLTTWSGITPGSGVAAWIATPSSANLAAAVTGGTGSGALVFATSPSLVTPALGTPSSGVLSSCTGYAASALTGLGANVAAFLATPSSANLIAALTDETGTGAAVFANTPTLVTPVLGTPTSGTLTNCTGLPVNTGLTNLSRTFSGYLYGLITSNNASDATNDIDISAGSCIDSTNAVLMNFSALIKRLDANWAAGTNQGMRNSAAAITDTTYHIYAVCKAAGADPDIYAHTSTTPATVLTALQAETGGSAYTSVRRIASIIRESATIIPYFQDGDVFTRGTAIQSVNATNPGTSAVTRTLNTPLGLRLQARVILAMANTSLASNAYISDLRTTDSTPLLGLGQASTSGAASLQQAAECVVTTDTSSQIRSRVNASDANTILRITTIGWIDTRGRLF